MLLDDSDLIFIKNKLEEGELLMGLIWTYYGDQRVNDIKRQLLIKFGKDFANNLKSIDKEDVLPFYSVVPEELYDTEKTRRLKLMKTLIEKTENKLVKLKELTERIKQIKVKTLDK